jgi:carboxyl-terminal processing protease
VLAEYNLSDGSAILLGVAEWLTPNGDFIRKSGIEPDIVVRMGKNEEPLIPSQLKRLPRKKALQEDPQLRRAYQVISGAEHNK